MGVAADACIWAWESLRTGPEAGARTEIDAHAARLWHHQTMKALKSPLATELLADPIAREQLRRFLVTRRAGAGTTGQGADAQVEIRRSKTGGTVKAVFVPKAKDA